MLYKLFVICSIPGIWPHTAWTWFACLGKMHKVVALLVLSENYGCPWLEGAQEHTRLYSKQTAINNRTALTAWKKRSPNRPSPSFLGDFVLLEPTGTGCSTGLTASSPANTLRSSQHHLLAACSAPGVARQRFAAHPLSCAELGYVPSFFFIFLNL